MYILTIQESFLKILPEPNRKVGFDLMNLFKPNKLEDIFHYGHIVVENDNSYDYLGFENGNFVYCQHNRLKNGGLDKNKLYTPNIQGVIQHIINSSEHKGRFKEKDFFDFNNKLLAKMSDNLVLEFPITKEGILEAFNFNKKLNTSAFHSCANFHNKSYPEPKVSWFDFYINNTDSIQVVVVKDEKGIIQGRSYFFFGEQQLEKQKIKKGTYVKFHNTVYGTPVAQAKIREFFKSEGIIQYTQDVMGVKINIVKEFPPVDCLYVDEENSLICSSIYKNDLKLAYKFVSQKRK